MSNLDGCQQLNQPHDRHLKQGHSFHSPPSVGNAKIPFATRHNKPNPSQPTTRYGQQGRKKLLTGKDFHDVTSSPQSVVVRPVPAVSKLVALDRLKPGFTSQMRRGEIQLSLAPLSNVSAGLIPKPSAAVVISMERIPSRRPPGGIYCFWLTAV